MLCLLALSCLLASATAIGSDGIMIEKAVARRVCMRSHMFEEMASKMEECRREVMPEDGNDLARHGDEDEEDFNLADFVKGYCAQKICTFEKLGWLKDCGNIDPMKVREFMYETRLGPAFGGEIGDEVVKDCMTDAAVITPNEFFNGVEPNNQEECNCEGECTGDKVCDCEGECDCAGESADRNAKKDKKSKKKRFSFKQMLEGAEQELGDAAEQAQKDMLNSVGLSEEEVEEILASSEEEMENAGKSGAHSHIHIPKGNKDDETDIDIVEEFAKLTSDEKKDVMMMLRPITFFRGIMDFFDITCEAFIGSSLETTLMAENQQQQFGAAPY